LLHARHRVRAQAEQREHRQDRHDRQGRQLAPEHRIRQYPDTAANDRSDRHQRRAAARLRRDEERKKRQHAEHEVTAGGEEGQAADRDDVDGHHRFERT
jgi:hypothetical protein